MFLPNLSNFRINNPGGLTLSPMRSSFDKATMALTSSSVSSATATPSSLRVMWLARITVANTGKPFAMFREPS